MDWLCPCPVCTTLEYGSAWKPCIIWVVVQCEGLCPGFPLLEGPERVSLGTGMGYPRGRAGHPLIPMTTRGPRLAALTPADGSQPVPLTSR